MRKLSDIILDLTKMSIGVAFMYQAILYIFPLGFVYKIMFAYDEIQWGMSFICGSLLVDVMNFSLLIGIIVFIGAIGHLLFYDIIKKD